jgi:hypothetical protein
LEYIVTGKKNQSSSLTEICDNYVYRYFAIILLYEYSLLFGKNNVFSSIKQYYIRTVYKQLYFYNRPKYVTFVSRDSSVIIVTRPRTGRSSNWGRVKRLSSFRNATSRPVLVSTQPPMRCITEALGKQSSQGMYHIFPFHVLPKLIMVGAIHPFTQTFPSRVA